MANHAKPEAPVFELTDGELGLMALALIDVLPRIQRYVNVTTDETVETDKLLFKLIEIRQAGFGFTAGVKVRPGGTELKWEKKDE
jgi:hypothetical protein